MHLSASGLALGLIFLARVGELADQLLLFRVHADNGLALGQEPPGGVVDVAELGVAVHVLSALFLLGGPLEAIAHLGQ